MLHTNNPIIKHKAGLLNLAEELGNVSKACKIMGVLHIPEQSSHRFRSNPDTCSVLNRTPFPGSLCVNLLLNHPLLR
ncbi:hypothetical protein VQ7734_02406 [Vibrio quintilis]|uniref:Uncharacterized protein n=1 Tax=Vibrio quintilis TaxID=1117707 RepID=A0A1M7YVC6_9VIBR|nr:hypothetical protein VQ7734_02406 [Vibrio quintilis]